MSSSQAGEPRNALDLPRGPLRAQDDYSLLDDAEIDPLEPLRAPPPPPPARRVSFAQPLWYRRERSTNTPLSDRLPRSRGGSRSTSGYTYHDATIDDSDYDSDNAILSSATDSDFSDEDDDLWPTTYLPAPNLPSSRPRRSSSTTTRPRRLPSSSSSSTRAAATAATTTTAGLPFPPRSSRAQPPAPRFRRNASGQLPRMLSFGGTRRGRYAEGYVPLGEEREEDECAVWEDSEEEEGAGGEMGRGGGSGGRSFVVDDEGDLEGEWRRMESSRGAGRSVSASKVVVPAWMH